MKINYVAYGLMALALVGSAYAIGPASSVTWISETRYNTSTATSAASDLTEGGNITELDLSIGNQTTDRWAGYLGDIVDNVTGGILLADTNAANIFYKWVWDPDNEAVVCAGEGTSYTWTSLDDASPAEINTAWGFNTSVSDNAVNTFNATAVSVTIANTTITPAFSAATGYPTPDGFATTPVKDDGATETDFLFCVNTDMSGATNGYKGVPVDYELIVPTTADTGAAGQETYYFYVELI